MSTFSSLFNQNFKYCSTQSTGSCNQSSAYFDTKPQLPHTHTCSRRFIFKQSTNSLHDDSFIWTNNFRSPRRRTLWCVSARSASTGRSVATVAPEGFATAATVSHGVPRFLAADSESSGKGDADRSCGCCCCWSNWYLCAGTTTSDCCCRCLGCNGPDGCRGGSVLTSPCWCSSLTPTCSANRTIV